MEERMGARMARRCRVQAAGPMGCRMPGKASAIKMTSVADVVSVCAISVYVISVYDVSTVRDERIVVAHNRALTMGYLERCR